ncbi:MAG: hypothetical protein JSS27_08360 [Planctomycetes bacterium]|nr:hypothetical protein [Planctomycetota bacterium]
MSSTLAPSPTLESLLDRRDRVQALLDRHNPGRKVDWMLSDRPWRIPPHCLERIERAGPAMHAFYRAAQQIFHDTPWVRQLTEKRYHPNYRRFNDSQPEAIPLNPRPDIVPDADWNPKFVELEITVGGRSDSELMRQAYGLPGDKSSVKLYAEMLRRRGLTNQPVAILCAHHPTYAELMDDARCYVSLLQEAGANVEALLEEDLPYLSYRDGKMQCLRPGHRFEFTHFDRLIDLFELAELAHLGMRPLLDAYLDGAVQEMNTCKQFFDEKIWMALFWDCRLQDRWRRLIDDVSHEVLSQIIPRTILLAPGAEVPIDGRWLPFERLAELPDEERRFVTKESGTSETAAAAQSFVVLSQMGRDEAAEHLTNLVENGPPSVLQELVESTKVEFTGLDPDTQQVVHQTGARVKMSAFYIDGALGDVLFISSNRQYAVHNEGYLETVVDRNGE